MVKVDIYRNSKQGYDILVLDTEQYLSSVKFDAVVFYLRNHISHTIWSCWFWDCLEENIQPCLQYQGIAIQLMRHLESREKAKDELLYVLQEALDTLNA